MSQVPTKVCPECGRKVPIANFVNAKSETRTGLPYKRAICFDCFTGEHDEE